MIEFENVSFSYQGQEHNGLHEINLKISDGECVLFCGRSRMWENDNYKAGKWSDSAVLSG